MACRSGHHACNIRVSIEGYSNTVHRHIEIPVGSRQKLVVLPVIGVERMKSINEPCPATLSIEFEYLLPFSYLKPYSLRIQLLPRNIAILWEYKEDGSLVDYTSSLTAWVTPHHSEIERLLNKATKYLLKKRFMGYSQVLAGEEEPQKVREQVRAIFETLHAVVQVKYLSSSKSIL
jgi:hypothetical protein